jgi:hypothetical protein
VGIGEHGGGPVDQCSTVSVDEQVEWVEIAVADDAPLGCGRSEALCDSRQVSPTDVLRLYTDAVDEVVDVVGWDNSITYVSAQYPPLIAAGGLAHAIAG